MLLIPQSFFANNLLTASMFNTISGSITGNPDGSISANTTRVRAILKQPLGPIRKISYRFRILGDSPTIRIDSDGVIRKGLVLWADMLNACNLAFLSCRTDDRESSGTTVIEGQTQLNPLITGPVTDAQLNLCAGQGYIQQSKQVLSIDIMDGQWHSFTVNRDPIGFTIDLDSQSLKVPVSLLDTGLYGLRTDNVNVQVFVEAS